jgi:hypothetical protein
LKFVRLPLQRCDQAEAVEDAGPKLRRDPAHGLNRLIDVIHHGLHFVLYGPRVARKSRHQPGHVEFQPRQSLSQLVVNFARNPRTLLLADVLEVTGERAQLIQGTTQLVLGQLAFAAICRLAQRALHGGAESGEPRLQHVISGAALQRLNRHFLAHRAGHENERDIRDLLLRQCERRVSIKGGQRVVAQDHIRRMVLDLIDERVPRLDPRDAEPQPAVAQVVLDELGMGRVVLQQQNSQLARRSAALGRG